MPSSITIPIRYSIVLLISMLLITGCSSSGDSSSANSQSPADVINTDQGGIITDDGNTDSTNPTENTDSVPSATNDIVNSPNPIATDPINAAAPEPKVQNFTQVSFDVTVPAYQSNALQVQVVWGEMTINADWVGDEFWTATVDLPTDTENLLTVSFFDNNGDITLASFIRTYRTGTNASETIAVPAGLFVTDEFDNDQDGVSNFDELIAGTDPLVDEDSLLEIRDFFVINNESRFSVSKNFEAAIGEVRPFTEMLELEEVGAERIRLMQESIDIDTQGNGTYSFLHEYGSSTLRSDTGTRTRSDNSITWEGRHGSFTDGFLFGANFTNTVTILDSDTISFVQNIEGTRGDFYTTTWASSSDFTAIRIEDTSLCQPVTGTFTESFRTNRVGGLERTTTISKEVDDRYWRAVETITHNDTSITEFLIRELFIYRTADQDPIDIFFTCDFVDF